jgi:hypothetical protein
MLFAMSVTVNEHSYLHVHKLESIPRDIDQYLTESGWPVKPYLIKAIDSNPDVAPVVVAYPDQLGWIEQEGLLYEFTIDDMNYISLHDGGYVYVYTDDENEDELVLEDGKAVLAYCDYVNMIDNDWMDDDIDWNDESWQWKNEN